MSPLQGSDVINVIFYNHAIPRNASSSRDAEDSITLQNNAKLLRLSIIIPAPVPEGQNIGRTQHYNVLCPGQYIGGSSTLSVPPDKLPHAMSRQEQNIIPVFRLLCYQCLSLAGLLANHHHKSLK